MIEKRYIMDRYNSCLREGKYGSYQKKYEWGVAVRSAGSSGGCSREDVPCHWRTSAGYHSRDAAGSPGKKAGIFRSGNKVYVEKNLAVCRGVAGIWHESQGRNGNRSSVSPYHRMHYRDIAGHSLRASPGGKYSREDIDSDRCRIVHMRRIGYRGNGSCHSCR